MSTHPNVILMAVLTPDGLSRKTMKAILEHESSIEPEVVIVPGSTDHNDKFRALVMEDDYNESDQIGAPEGSLVFFDLITYGYGESLTWENLETRKDKLEQWAQRTAKEHDCSYEIRISANYW